ncbi:MAG: hypothetical protein V3U11_13830 [Planctomycetota bacterium]
MMLTRVAQVVPLAVLLAASAGDAPAQLPRFYLAAEFGLRDLTGSPFEQMAKKLMRELADVDDPKTQAYRECLLRQHKACLPVRISVFTSSPAGGRRVSVAVVVDSAAALDLAPLKRALGDSLRRIEGFKNGWRDDGGVFLNQLELAKDRHRVVMIAKVDEDPTRSGLFRGRALPKVRERRERQLQKLRTAPAYALGDLIRVARAMGSKGDRLLLSPSRYTRSVGLEVGVAFREDQGRPVLDLSSTLPLVTGGFLGMPKDLPERCRALGSLPPKPDLIVLADYGKQGQLHGLAWLLFLQFIEPDQSFTTAADKLAACWTGSASLYAQVDDELARGGLAFELNKGHEEEALRWARTASRALMKKAEARQAAAAKEQAESEDDPQHKDPRVKVRLDWAHIVVDAKDGLLVCGYGPSEEYAVAMVQMILAGKGPRTELPKKLHPEEGPSVAWCRQGFVTGYVRRLLEQHEQLEKEELMKPTRRFGYRLLMKVARLLLEHVEPNGMTCTMRWENMRLQLRVRL